MGASNSTHIFGTYVPVQEPSTASIPDSCTAARRGKFSARRRAYNWHGKNGALVRFDFGLECDPKAGPQQIVRIRKLQPDYYCLRLSFKFITTADITVDLRKFFTVRQ